MDGAGDSFVTIEVEAIVVHIWFAAKNAAHEFKHFPDLPTLVAGYEIFVIAANLTFCFGLLIYGIVAHFLCTAPSADSEADCLAYFVPHEFLVVHSRTTACHPKIGFHGCVFKTK